MREILFRGKRKVCDEWVYGFPFISRKGEYKIKWYDGYYGSSKTSEIYTESICQFTGLTDKNGKKIFEGDIVKTKYGRLCIVVWFLSPAHCGWDLNPIGSAENCIYTKAPDRSDLYKSCNLEVIGNIHDNPELLNGGDEE